MYNIELQHLTLENAQNETLSAIENLCSSFNLEDHFGTISFAMHELLELMERHSDSQYTSFDINFYIEQNKVSVQIVNYHNFKEIEQDLQQASLDDVETGAFTIVSLTDGFEFRDNYNEMWVDIMVNADIEQIDRAQILEQENVLSRAKTLNENRL